MELLWLTLIRNKIDKVHAIMGECFEVNLCLLGMSVLYEHRIEKVGYKWFVSG